MWKYESNDNQSIALHDHIIDKISIDENESIILVFNDGFDIVNTHPLNDTKKSKHTTKSQIVLKNAHFLSGISSMQEETRSIDFLTLLKDLVDFEVLEFRWESNVFRLLGELTMPGFNNEFVELLFSCSDAIFCWDDYSSDAWFEGWPPSKK